MKDIHKLIRFLNIDIWRIRTQKLSRSRSLFINQLRIILLALRGYNEDKCQLRASALTFYTLLSVVPILAMAFGIAKGFGFDQVLAAQIMAKLPGQEEMVGKMIGFANAFLENTKGGLIAGVGVALLFWTIIKVLGNIEDSFNDIWGVPKGRSLSRKFSDYLSIMLICPLFFIMSSSVTVVIAAQIQYVVDKLSFLGPVSHLILVLLKVLPYVVMWALFTFIYVFMPNTKVNIRSGFLGGIIAGTIYQAVQWVYITFQIGVSNFGAIYGSFAALPLFLVWLQISWLIVLFGAEISFAEQNVDTYEFEPDCLKVSAAFKRLVALSIARLCVKQFDSGQPPLSAYDIAHALEMPIRLVRLVLFELTEARVLSEIKPEDGKSPLYQPARDIADLTIHSVSNMLQTKGEDNIPLVGIQEIDVIRRAIEDMESQFVNAPSNVALKDI
ncbi:MAG: YihY/virulence factor BrkB family protein [Candidatus Omnitrophica bacterium]|nr:YihY/virulence factor BrkB family protein [Candidatus Omnitrophota bacterium]